jgi:hypothetical protein
MGEAVITYTEIARILDKADAGEERALVALAWEIGASLRTIQDLKVADFRLGKAGSTVMLGDNRYPLNLETAEILSRYIREGKLSKRSPLFPNRSTSKSGEKKKAHERRLQRVVEQAGERIGLKKLTLHSIRKARAYTLVTHVPVDELAKMFRISETAASQYYKNLPFDPFDKSMARMLFGLAPLPTGEYGYTPDMARVRAVLLEVGRWNEEDIDRILLCPTVEGAQLRLLLHSAWEIDQGPFSMGNRKIRHVLLQHVVGHESVIQLMEEIKTAATGL